MLPRAGLLCALALLGGCGDDDDDDDDDDTGSVDAGLDAAPPDAAPPDAAAPDSGVDAGPESPIVWHDCPLPFRCGTLPLPLDYADPDGPTIDVSFVRTFALSPEDRIGLLMLNPGGPGASAIEFARGLAANAAQLAPEILRRFDVVALDPRGVGESTPVDCVDDDVLAAGGSLDLTPEDEEEWTAAEDWARTFVDGCEERSPELVRHVDTESVAHDMDRLREALGEEQISYWGISYGTFLGATYATLFPERVRAFVLDSPVAPADDLIEYADRQVAAYEIELGRFFDHCGPRGQCAFHGGEGAEALGTAFDALLVALDAEPLPAGDGVLTETSLRGAVVTLLRQGDWDALDEALGEADAGDGTLLAASPLFPSVEFHAPISILDQGCPPDWSFDDLRQYFESARLASPRVGVHVSAQAAFCGIWPLERPVPRTPIDASSAPAMLVMAGEHDPATPLEYVEPFLTALGNDSHLLTWLGDGHGVAFRNGCTIAALVDFLVDPSSPPRDDVCSP